MANENVNKVIYGNDTLIDLTNDSVSPQTLLVGATAHDRSGSQIAGQATQGHTIIDASGSPVNAESGLQFATMQVTDDSTNGKTTVRHVVYLTRAEYDALPSTKNSDSIIYVITDGSTGQIQANNVGFGNSTVAAELNRLDGAKVENDAVSEYVETIGETAQGSYKVGDYFLAADGYYYRCKSAITAGSTTITTNNAEQTTISKAMTQSVNYSTAEHVIGTWIDGKPIYRKVIDFGNLPNSTNKGVNHNITNLDHFISVIGFAYAGSAVAFTIPLADMSLTGQVGIYATNTAVQIQTGQDRSGYTAYVILEYTKTA